MPAPPESALVGQAISPAGEPLLSVATLDHGDHAVRRYIVQHLPDAARPGDFYLLGSGIRAETEMHTRIARRRISHAGRDMVILHRTVRGGHPDFCADSHAVTFGAAKLQQYPVIAVPRGVVENFRLAFQYRDHHVHSAVIVQVPQGRPTVPPGDLEIRPGRSADVLEFAVSKISKHCIWLRERTRRK